VADVPSGLSLTPPHPKKLKKKTYGLRNDAVSLTYLLTELTLLEKPPIVQLLKNFPAFYGTQRFITVFT
jgi:hypothetical protein